MLWRWRLLAFVLPLFFISLSTDVLEIRWPLRGPAEVCVG